MIFLGRFLAVLACVAAFAPAAHAVDAASLPEAKRTQLGLYFTPKEAYDFVRADPAKVLFVDVRTQVEAAFVGMPTDADANVPYMRLPEFLTWDAPKNTLKLELNPDFVPAVDRLMARKGLSHDQPVVVICRSGDRSAAATNLLAKAGYSKVYTVVEGFEGDLAKDGPTAGQRTVNGWKNAGLPWSYKLSKQKIYGLE